MSITSVVPDAYSRRRIAAILTALVVTVVLPFIVPALTGSNVLLLLALGTLIVVLALVSLPLSAPSSGADSDASGAPARGVAGGSTDTGSPLRNSVQLILYLSPVLLLSVAFPVVSPAMARATVGGVSLSTVVLAVSITVPWLSQAACLPLYRVLGDLIEGRDMAAISRRFGQFGVLTFAQTLPIIVVFAVPVAVFTGWGAAPLGVYLVLCALHVLFAQTLVLANISRRRGMWAVAWGAYAVALTVAPTVWWLPPVAGVLSQIALLRPVLGHLGALQHLSAPRFAADALRGVLLGSVLWSDKFFLYLASDGRFAVTTIFAAMLPAVIAYNFYFVRLAPAIDDSVGRLRHAISHEPINAVRTTSAGVFRTLDRAVLHTGAVGMVLTLGICLLLGGLEPQALALAVAVSVSTWLFMMLTLLGYELDYIGERLPAQVLGAVHLAVCAAAFLGLGPGLAYVVVLVVDAALVAVAWLLYRRHWTHLHFTLFWRHATSW